MITTTEALSAFCLECARHPYVTIDTEFHRERTYYSQLCLMQIAYPGDGEEAAVLGDTLAPELDLAPVFELFKNPNVVKVFRAARQDLEIFFVEGGIFPEPFFDTQVAAMVCGFGEQVGYETLVRKLARASLDKTSRFTDWTRRPLTNKQQAYALADVTHLRTVYEQLSAQLDEENRRGWVDEELQILIDPMTYEIEPTEIWRRIKTRNSSGAFLSILRELAAFRELTARSRNVPRNRIMKDDAILEVASTRPKTVADLSKSRLLLREARKGEIAEGILAAIERGVATSSKDHPKHTAARQRRVGQDGLVELLRVLLKAKADEAGVAARLIASNADLEEIACDEAPEVRALTGWRREVFGNDALRLKSGEVALTADGDAVRIVPISVAPAKAAE